MESIFCNSMTNKSIFDDRLTLDYEYLIITKKVNPSHLVPMFY